MKRIINLADESFLTQEQLDLKTSDSEALTIGIPRETDIFEKRVPLTPEGVRLLVERGLVVIVESGAGQSAYFSDIAYTEVGAIVSDNKDIVWKCDIIIKLSTPEVEELKLVKNKTTIFSFLQYQKLTKELIALVSKKKINLVAYELICDDKGEQPINSRLREIEGKTAIVMASDLLTNCEMGKGILIGGCTGVPPTEVVVLGAGKAAEVAAKTAATLGAMVKIFDKDIEKLYEIGKCPGVFTSTMHPSLLRNSLKTADIVIGALTPNLDEEKFFITEDLLKIMKKKAVLVDLNVCDDYCFESSRIPKNEDEVVFEKYGIIHFCDPNISSRVAKTSSMSLSDNIMPMICSISDCKYIKELIRKNEGIRKGVYIYNGKIVNKNVGDYFSLPWNDINIFLTSFQ